MTKNVEGWEIGVEYGQWITSLKYKSIFNKCGKGRVWYGWSHTYKAGFIRTTLYGTARGQLNFGNCGTSGIVQVFLDETVIGYANHNTPSKVIEFDYTNGSKLELRDTYGNPVIRFNSLKVLSCGGKLPIPHIA